MQVLGSLTLLADSATGVGRRAATWPSWQRFKLLYLSPDGRVLDASNAQQATTSESQAYALFFALVANDRAAFDDILDWTESHLAGGEFAVSLPARRWGRDNEDVWRVLDQHSHANADLWIAYSLGEAARLWNEAAYLHLGHELSRNIVRYEVASIQELGTALLAGSAELGTEPKWRLIPGDLTLPAIRGVARHSGEPIWTEIAHTSERILLGSIANGGAADQVEFTASGGFTAAAAAPGQGVDARDAMRVYLWAGMLPASDPAKEKLALALKPTLSEIAKQTVADGTTSEASEPLHDISAPGFSAALLPMLANARLSSALQIHRKRAADECLQDNRHSYRDMLSLFGLGWLEQRYRFNRTGLLSVRWTPGSDRPH